MDISGMNPIHNQPIAPGQQGPQAAPDLVLNPALNRATQQSQQPPQTQQAASTQAPFQAPEQALVQHSAQNMTAALMEMNIPPTPQNVQVAQLLASYGHAVNTRTMGIVKNAMLGISDKSVAAMEATVILLSRGIPVTETIGEVP